MKNEMSLQPQNSKVILNPYPSTWPADGPIDLKIHDFPHNKSIIEWWYQNCHLSSKDGRQFSVFASFFRTSLKDERTGDLTYAHSVIWSLSDKDARKYYSDSLVDQSMPAESIKVINKKEDLIHKPFYRALKELYEKGNVPLPDRLLKKPATIGVEEFSLEYDENSFKKDKDDTYHLRLNNSLKEVECKLQFIPLIKPIKHGEDGCIAGISKSEDMFYYFIPKCGVTGEIRIGNEIYEVEGSGWYDHEFSKPGDEIKALEFKQDMAWNWVSLQLDNEFQLSVYDLFDNTKNGEYDGGTAVIIDKDGKRISIENYSFSPKDYWTSTKTFVSYPISWNLEMPDYNVSLTITADFPEQEFITALSLPAIWEGCVHASGNFMHTQVKGLGYVEIAGFNANETIESFLKAVGKTTQKTVENLLPLVPTDDEFYKLVNSPLGVNFFSQADKEQYVASVVKPVREIVDRNKKSWRSYVLLACIDSVGGDSQPFINLLAMPELIHTGSLIVDDVQDKSEKRRGGKTLHHIYGEPLAINAGNACYFIGDIVVGDSQISEQIRLKIYQLFFEMMRAAHAGQALDISGLHAFMPEAVRTGDCTALEKRLYTIHRLKTAAPACTLARIGGIIGNGTPEEIDEISNYFEAAGMAYQIMDDVLNLKGFENNLKDKGEDITAGKITMPVAKAMGLLNFDEREYVWKTIQTMPTDEKVIRSVINVLQSCGAIDACAKEAEDLIEAAWKKIDIIVPDSFYKVRLRAFGWFILQKD
ncbi:polyprenyl synthetase family protein [Flavobacterium sp. GSB-24]|uniref:polyprenyl synthetase family protein n=1 Tax=Flavobacterium sp. GSB-24 TaxID=2994319 RepID=UPI00249217F6|nr:polyprenyl synthetase family protein [Flavobacterium sp. GSB-24]BDU26215.1 hypothetical protein FLGSB24_29590 [Flavobacterium sp. GSB-24]